MNRRAEGLAIAVGGATGAIIRVSLDAALPIGSGFPWATFLCNVVGAAILGAVAAAPVSPGRLGNLRMPLLGIGLCGGLTTFSALSWELFDLLEQGSVALALVYATVSLALGLGALVITGRIARGRSHAGSER